MYLTAGDLEESIYQYELSIPWDISTAKIEHGLWVASTEVSSYAANETAPRDVGFGSDGKYMYLIGQNSDTVFQWTLGTPYQINTAGLTTSFDVNSEEAFAQWVGFSTGGDRMYILGDSDEINEYSLSTPWFVDSASFDSNTVISESSDESAGYIKPDGTKMWMIDNSTSIHEHNFGTPWDSSTLTVVNEDTERYTGDPNSPLPKKLNLLKYGLTAAEGLYFSPDGFNMYVADAGLDGVFRFHMDIPWDFVNAKPKELPYGYLFDDVTDNYLQTGVLEVGNPEDLSFSADGTTVSYTHLTLPTNREL